MKTHLPLLQNIIAQLKKAVKFCGPAFIAFFALCSFTYALLKPAVTYMRRQVQPQFTYAGFPSAYVVNKTLAFQAPAANNVDPFGYQPIPTTIGPSFPHPNGLAVDRYGDIFIVDYQSGKLSEISAGSNTVTTISSAFALATSVAVDYQGNIYVTEGGSSLVYERLTGGNVVTVGSGFDTPVSVAVDRSGNVFVADQGTNKVYRVQSGGSQSVIASGFTPGGVAVDALGNLYITDYNNHVLKELPVNGGGIINTSLGNVWATKVAVDGNGNAYIEEPTANRVMLLSQNGALSAIGSGFSTPDGLGVTGDGSLYIADTGHGAIKLLQPSGGFFVAPSLPAGLTLNNSNGAITGKPTAVNSLTTYTVTAYNSTASNTATVAFKVNALGVAYPSNLTFTANTQVSAVTPVIDNTVGTFGYGGPLTLGAGFSAVTGVTVDAAGNIYVADYGASAVKKIMANGAGTITIGSGFNHPNDVAVDAAGNVYVADGGNNAIKKVPPSGPIITLGSGFTNPTSVEVDAAGNVFVGNTTSAGVFEIPAGTNNVLTITRAVAGPVGLFVDPNDNVYVSDKNASSIYRTAASGGATKAIGGGLSNIRGVVADAVGNIYVVENTKNDVVKIAAGTQVITTVITGLNNPQGLAMDAAGALYVADQGSATVKKFNPTGGFFISAPLPAGLSFDTATGAISGTAVQSSPAASYTVTAYNSTGYGSSTFGLQVNNPALPTLNYATPQKYVINTAVSPLAPAASGVAPVAYSTSITTAGSGFSNPEAVAVDAAGNIYVADYGHSQVKKIPAGGGAPVVIGTGFLSPEGVAVDTAGNVYVADFGNNAVKKIPVGSNTPVVIGSGFSGPAAVAADATGNVFVADFNNNAVKKIPAGNGTPVTLGSGFNHPTGVAVDGNGNVFVSDGFNNAVKKIPVGGGAPVTIGPFLSAAYGLEVDGAGNVFVADRGANAIYQIPADGSASFTVGTGFNSPYDVAIDASGNLYVADYSNSQIKFVPKIGGYYLDKSLPAGLIFDSNTGVISGTPTALSPAATYTITGSNAGGSRSSTVSISVNQFPAPDITYGSAKAYKMGTTISPVTPANTGGPVLPPGYNSLPVVLGSGFSFATGVAADLAGNVYVADRGNNVVKKIPGGVGSPVVIGTGFSSPACVAVDAAGNVFVSDGGNNAVKKIPADGGPIVSVGSGFINPFGVAVDAMGNVYVVDYGNNLVKKIPFGSNSPIVIGSGFNAPVGVAVDGAGNVYVADYGNNAVKKIPVGGGAPVVLGSGFSRPAGVAVDLSGNVFVADYLNSAIKEIPAGGGAPVTIGSGFSGPFGVAVGNAGNVYVADYLNSLVKQIIPGGGYYANNLPAGLTIDNASGVISGTPTTPSFATLYTLTAYNATGGNSTTLNIRVSLPVVALPAISYASPQTLPIGTPVTISPTNTGGAVPATVYSTVSTLAGSGTAGSGDGTGAAASFNGPMNMAADVLGNIYVADFTANVIRKVTPGGVASTFAGSGVAGNANGIGTAASFNGPAGIAIDGLGNVYVGDSGNNLIRKITQAGVVTTFAGSGLVGNTDGTGTAAKFHSPHGLVFDGSGNLYVADQLSNIIRKITPAGVVSRFAGSGTAGSTNGTGTAATFNSPMALGADTANNIYVADYTSNLIRKITQGGVVTTFAGSGTAGNADGTGTAASFKNPYGITTDGNGNFYVADRGNNLIRMISPAGVVTTLAGSTAGSVNGVGTAAKFSDPRGVAFSQGTLYVSDFGGHQLRAIALTGYTIDKNLPAGLAFDGTTGTISGTPVSISLAANYVITGFNQAGSDVVTVNIKVNTALPAPDISYTTPQTLTTGTGVSIMPANSGGTVPATIYSTVGTLAGSGAAGSANGTGSAATFNGLMNMATDASGNIYAADFTANVIRKITPAGVTTTLAGSGMAGNANGTGTAATFNGPAGIALDAAGNIYVGDSGNNLIRKITPGGVVTTFAGSGAVGNTDGTGTAAKFHSPHGLAFDGNGNLYVADQLSNIIRRITPGAVVTRLAGSGTAGSANGTGTAATFNSPMALGTDALNNIYVADYTGNLIRKITPAGVVTTFAGSGTAGATDGTGTAASFKNPYAIATDGNDNLYIADRSNNLIRVITSAGVVTTLAGSTAGSVDGVGMTAKFNDPRGVAISNGHLYVADFGGHQVRSVTLTGYTIDTNLPAGLAFDGTTGVISGTPAATSAAVNYIVTAYNATGSNTTTINIKVNAGLAAPNIKYTTPQTFTMGTAANVLPTNTGGAVPATVYSTVSTLAGSGTPGSADGSGAAATFSGLMNMATDAIGNIYVADFTANVIRKLTPAGVASTLAGSGTAGNTNGMGTAASFNGPAGIAVDASGNVYVGDSGNNLIRKITPGGAVTTFAGSGAVGNTDGTGTAAKFHGPHGLVFDGAGNLYVADQLSNIIRKITPAAIVTRLAGSGTAGSANGTGTAATFNSPMALGIDGLNNIYVADYTGNLIRRITPAGVVTTFAGDGTSGSADGTGTAASFKNPYAITTDGDDNLYIADRGNNKIRKITPAGIVTTLAGSGSVGSTNGIGAAAKFSDPRGVAFDHGILYVADFGGHQVRKILLTGYTIFPALPAGLSLNSSTGRISGTPVTAASSANYTVFAYNASGFGSAMINITVNAMSGMAMAQPDIPIALPIANSPVVKQGVSPNGDGINDVLVIDNIEQFPDNKIIIMNNAGSTVYQATGYNNTSTAFDGHSNKTNAMQKPGTYFYELEYKDKGATKHKTGYILLKY